ncbi:MULTISPECIES: 2-amino-4-hydroxy-6-hydroxymethyldihydropteridine diphosphokinase [Clostridium]|uniref:Bifunctional folate synthesis protein n=1 Tax=Clostridium cibarium TaxID=2762247 RepID=A0ABR8PP03_9CLOT|nr:MULTISPECIES: 2-amino-4-hydroxy-6-hydroxymethyldihydropteridine diphosphokinase [Clostridium]MBD7909919.1 2-amino-4-hydroxy-6-hydroxymethyldihydropteridine diphosphokinase [Clostridium cibarium]
MDKIYIKNFEIFANHGVFSEEKNLGQKFILDIELSLPLEEAGKTENLKKSVHYGELCLGIERVFTEKSYDLIESAAEKIAEFTLTTYPIIKSVKVKLKKPWAPIGRHVDYAAVEIERGWHEAYLSVGSNIGNKEDNLNIAIKMLKETKEVMVEKVSSFIVTEPWGNVDQDEFLNGALMIRTTLSPKYLLDKLLEIEEKMHRVREVKWGPRIIDLDVIFYDDLVLEDDYITIPHPRMEEREFVLKPLSEIAPNKVHPLLNKRIFKMLEELK